MSPERFEARFGPRTDRSGPCWVWMGAHTSRGYGSVSVTLGGRHRMIGLHRLAYETFIGPIRSGMQVCHTCDTPACWRPDHLFQGAHQDNQADKARKGRALKRLTLEQVDEIRARYRPGRPGGHGGHHGIVGRGPREDSIRALAMEYGVSSSTIYGHLSA